MKTNTKKIHSLAIATVLLWLSSTAIAGPGHHDKKEAGPNGGRLVTNFEPHYEFLLLEDRSAQLTFVDESGQPVAPSGQVAKLIGGNRQNPTQLSFRLSDDKQALISEGRIPEGDRLPIILQMKASAEASATTERFNLNTANCSGCSLSEYACTCGH